MQFRGTITALEKTDNSNINYITVEAKSEVCNLIYNFKFDAPNDPAYQVGCKITININMECEK